MEVADEQAFLQGLRRESPRDIDLRLVYADWLEEQGDPRAEFLRLDVQLTRSSKGAAFKRRLARWQKLRSTLDPVWVSKVARANWGVMNKHHGLFFTQPHLEGGIGVSELSCSKNNFRE